MQKKVSQARHYILEMLEQGKLVAGNKLPGARTLATESGISFVKIQQAIDSLAVDGILTTMPRQGTYVRDNWYEKIIPSLVSIHCLKDKLPWLEETEALLNQQVPDLKFAYSFPRAMFEVRVSISVIHDQNDYMDLTPIFKELFPDNSDFFMEAFKPFTSNNKLFGIPFSISPRVIFVNTDWLKKAGCTIPRPGWTWNEFLDCITQLKSVMPAERIFNFQTQPFLWMNFIFRAGGCLINQDPDQPVKIDSSETQRGISLFRQLQQALGGRTIEDGFEYEKAFADEECALYLANRHYLPYILKGRIDNWVTMPLPYVENGVDMNVQGTELLCIRKSCPDMELAKTFIKTMLSTDVQDILAKERHGIPVRKSSAVKSIDFTDPRDTLFLNELPKMSADYNISSPELSALIYKGIADIWEKDLDIEQATEGLANAVRVLLKIRENQ